MRYSLGAGASGRDRRWAGCNADQIRRTTRASLGNSFPTFERSVSLVVVADDQAVAGVKLLVFEQH